MCLATETVCLLFVGHLDNSYSTAGVGLSMIFVNCTCQSVLCGLNNAISVLASIAYGQKDWNECENILHRGQLLCAIGFVPLALIEYNCENILLFVGIEEEVARYAQEYTNILYPAMFFHM